MQTLREAIELAAQRSLRAKKAEALDASRRLFQEAAERLNDRLRSGEIQLVQWSLDMQQLAKDLHTSAYVAGKSGDFATMTRADWGRVGSTLRTQYAFVRRWAIELGNGELPSLAKLNARAGLYAAAASQSFEAGIASEIGLDPGQLPSWPGDGTTSCRANCRCRWSVRILSKTRGNYDVTWVLGAAEHCPECRRRARHRLRGGWGGLRIRQGRLIDTPSAEGTFRQ